MHELLGVRFSLMVIPRSFHSLTLSSLLPLLQMLNCSSLSYCYTYIFLAVSTINFVLSVLNTRLDSIDHFTIEVASFSCPLIQVSFWLILQVCRVVESSACCMQLTFGLMLEISATHRLNKIDPSIEPWGTPYLAVRKDERFESICIKCCLCVRYLNAQFKKSVEKFSECIFRIKVPYWIF